MRQLFHDDVDAGRESRLAGTRRPIPVRDLVGDPSPADHLLGTKSPYGLACVYDSIGPDGLRGRYGGAVGGPGRGGTVHPPADFGSFARRQGVVHCIKMYLRRGDRARLRDFSAWPAAPP